VRRFYFQQHVLPGHGRKGIRSRNVAIRAFALMSVYLAQQLQQAGVEGAPRIGHMTLARQEGFMRWCRDKHSLSGKTISIYLSSIKAGVRFAARPRLVTDVRGREREVQVLDRIHHIEDGEAAVAKVTHLPRSQPRSWIPNDEELARFIAACDVEHVFRYIILQLNTWARPEAICELSVTRQVDFGAGTVDMNPPGRAQNNKIRPRIPLTDNLRGWLLHWNLDRPIIWTGAHSGQKAGADPRPIRRIDNRTLARIAKRAGIEGTFTKYTLRHYMATRVRRVEGIPVEREQRAAWMGHTDPHYRTTEQWYESHDPDHLVNVARAIDAIMLRLDQIGSKTVFSPNSRPSSGLVLLKRKDN
jgi:integrase